jgi:hypothetical protein
MASPYISPSSGGASGGRFATRSPIYSAGVTWFVGNSSGGVDGASPQGRERAYPLATLAQAYTNASQGDEIRFLEGHAETLTVAQTIAKADLYICSEGSATTRARFTCNGAIAMFDVGGTGRVIFDNLYFPQSSAVPTARIRVGSGGCRIWNCQFDCGANDTGPAVQYVSGTGQCFMGHGTKFLSTATAAASRPSIGLQVLNAISDLELDTVIFDGGTYGWSDYALNATAAVNGLVGIDVDFLNGADLFTATGSVYRFHNRNKSGSVRLVFTA